MVEQNENNELYDMRRESIVVQNAESDLLKNIELIQKAIDGDKKAFDQLYMQSYRYVFFVIRSMISDDETTYDAIQETFIKVFKGISGLRAPEAYYAWLTTIAKNTAKNFLRSRHSDKAIDDNDDYSEFLNQDKFEKDVSLDVAAVLKELEPQDAELLGLVYYDGMRVSQIAKMRGVPAATVYTQLGRAKRKLKAQLSVHGIDKAIYSGNFVAMIATTIRNIIGTSLLSVAIAQQILNSVVNGKGKKEIAVAKVVKQQQKKNILKIASCIVAISMITSIVTVLAIIVFSQNKPLSNGDSVSSSDNVISFPQENDDDISQSSDMQTDTDNIISQNNNTQTNINDNTYSSSLTDNQSPSDTKEDTSLDETEKPNSSTANDSSNTSSDVQPPITQEELPKYTAAKYIYRDATAEDCFTNGNIPAQPFENYIVIIDVETASSDGVYTIPETIDGKRVGGIMPSAFCNPNISSTVKKVIVPATVKTIWQGAFSDCYNLTDIYLRGSIIDIFENAFADSSMRNSELTIHCSYDCKNFSFYYYRNKAENYDAIYKEWSGENIQ